MTEKEKMLAEQYYNPIGVEELRIERDYCKDLCYEYNRLKPSQVEEQEVIIRKIFGKVAGDICVMAPFWCDYGYNIEAGERLYINHNCVILERVIRSMQNSVMPAWNMADPLKSEMMCGLAVMFVCFRELQSEIMW